MKYTKIGKFLTCSMYQKGGKIIVESRRTEVEYSDGEAAE